MTCLALDDEPLALQLLELYVRRIPELDPKGFLTNPVDAHQILMEQEIDLLFLDIQMPEITGLKFLKSLKKPPLVIFSTAYREFAVEGFELNAVDYLLKPFEFERFITAIQKAREHLAYQQKQTHLLSLNDHFFVKSEYRMVKIKFDDLQFIEAYDDYLKIHLRSTPKPVLTLATLKSMQETLPTHRFLRVHRSYLVSLDKVKSIRRRRLLLDNRMIPVGDRYWTEVKAFFENKRLFGLFVIGYWLLVGLFVDC